MRVLVFSTLRIKQGLVGHFFEVGSRLPPNNVTVIALFKFNVGDAAFACTRGFHVVILLRRFRRTLVSVPGVNHVYI